MTRTKTKSDTTTSVVGILNVTPDSFSDGGRFQADDAALAHASEMITDGATIIECGAESTAPGSSPVSADEELSRLRAVVNALINSKHSVPLAIDTYKASVAEWCLSLGAGCINDVSALRADPLLARVIAAHHAQVVIMYSKEPSGLPHVSTHEVQYHNVIRTITDFLSERIEYALAQGIEEKNIILDPGMGRFISKDPHYSWEVLRRFEELTTGPLRNFPFMIATSRKGFLGVPLIERDPLSQRTAIDAVKRGAKYIRTHNVKMAREYLRN